MSKPLTRAEVRELLREIVAEFPPGYTYEQVPCFLDGTGVTGCIYTVEGQPSCLVGQLLHRLGVQVPEVDQMHPIDLLLRNQRAYLKGLFADDVILYLGDVQRYQDSGASWSECLEIAERRVVPKNINRSVDDDPKATV